MVCRGYAADGSVVGDDEVCADVDYGPVYVLFFDRSRQTLVNVLLRLRSDVLKLVRCRSLDPDVRK